MQRGSTPRRHNALAPRIDVECLEHRRLLAAQPMLIADLASGAEGSYPTDFVVFDGRLFFGADQDGNSHDALYAYDGVSPVRADPSRDYTFIEGPAGLNGTLYFTAANIDDVGWEVWRHDGASSTMLLGQDNGYYLFPPGVHAFGGELLFWGHREVVGDDPVPGQEYGSGLWTFDGTRATLIAPQLSPDIDYSHLPYGWTEFNGALYFVARDKGVAEFAPLELWRYDGQSVTRAPGIAPGAVDAARELEVFGGAMYFAARTGPDDPFMKLWRYDGQLAAPVAAASDVFNPSSIEGFDGSIYFFASGDETHYQLWRYDPAAGTTTRLTDQFDRNNSHPPYGLTAVGRTLYFWGTQNLYEFPRLWAVQDGEARPVGGLRDGTDFAVFQGDLYFGASDGVHGQELWKLSGRASGAGDADGDGRITADDYFAIDRGRRLRLTGFANGDFDHSGGVADADDYALLDRLFLGQFHLEEASAQSGGAPAPVAPALPSLFDADDEPPSGPPVWDEA